MEPPAHTPDDSSPDDAAGSRPGSGDPGQQFADAKSGDGSVGPSGLRLDRPTRFCPSCGTAWDTTWAACPFCTRREERRREARCQPASPQRPVVSALGLYFALLATTAIGVVVDAVVSGPSPEASEPRVWLWAGVVDAIIVLLWCAASWASIRSGLTCLSSPRWYLAAATIPVGTFVAASAAVWVLVNWLDSEEILYAEPLLSAGFGWWVVVLAVCVQPALVEELAFRGVILSALQRVLNVREAVVVSALLFMVIHLAVLSFPHLLIIGLALGYLRVRTGSIYPCMLAHFVHNLLVVSTEQL